MTSRAMACNASSCEVSVLLQDQDTGLGEPTESWNRACLDPASQMVLSATGQ